MEITTADARALIILKMTDEPNLSVAQRAEYERLRLKYSDEKAVTYQGLPFKDNPAYIRLVYQTVAETAPDAKTREQALALVATVDKQYPQLDKANSIQPMGWAALAGLAYLCFKHFD